MNKRAYLIGILLITSTATVVFSLLTLFSLGQQDHTNVLLAFYQALTSLITLHWPIAAVSSLLLCLFFFMGQFSSVKKPFTSKKQRVLHYGKKLAISLLTTMGVLLSSAHLGLVIASVSTVIALHQTTSQISFITELAAIDEYLQQAKKPPAILTSFTESQQQTILQNALQTHKKLSGFASKNIAPQLPTFAIPQLTLPTTSLVLFDDTLLINSLDIPSLAEISPELGFLLVRDFFNSRVIKEKPTQFEVVGRQSYLELRDVLINKRVEEMASEIKALSSRISQTQRSIDNVVDEYFNGLSYFDAINKINRLEGQLADLYEQRELLETQQQFVEAQKDIAVYELGIFLPEEDNAIKVVLDYDDAERDFYDYLATVIHEYLHYTTYITQERRLPLFFEEGLTEYFSRQIMEKSTQQKTEVGYPLITKVLSLLVADLDQNELAEVYFTKDEERLVALLDEEFGEDFYKRSELFFIAMPFVDLSSALKYANNITFEIGAPTISADEF